MYKFVPIIAVCLAFFASAFTQVQPPRDVDFINHRITYWKAAYPLGSFGNARCGYTQPKTLIIQDSDNAGFNVTFQGGKRMGGVFESSHCVGLAGYASRSSYAPLTSPVTQFSNVVSISFSFPVTLGKLRFQTKSGASYKITLNNGVFRTYQPSPRAAWEAQFPFRNPHFISDIGFTAQEAQNVTLMTIESLDTEWAFGIDAITFTEIGGTPGGGEPEPPQIGNPVILIPGVAGSELVEAGVRTRWLSDSVLSFSEDLEALHLPSNRNIYASDILRNQIYFNGTREEDSYRELYNFLLLPNVVGRLYDVAGIPIRRTSAGCDMAQDSSNIALKPRLFVLRTIGEKTMRKRLLL